MDVIFLEMLIFPEIWGTTIFKSDVKKRSISQNFDIFRYISKKRILQNYPIYRDFPRTVDINGDMDIETNFSK